MFYYDGIHKYPSHDFQSHDFHTSMIVIEDNIYAVAILITVLIIALSCVKIVTLILKIPSTEGRRKAFLFYLCWLPHDLSDILWQCVTHVLAFQCHLYPCFRDSNFTDVYYTCSHSSLPSFIVLETKMSKVLLLD